MKILLTSYPRSGNNWLGNMIKALLPGLRFLDLDYLSTTMSPEDLQRKIEQANTTHVLLKTHGSVEGVRTRYPFIGSDVHVVCIERHPLDVAVSLHRYLTAHFPTLLQGAPLDAFVEDFIAKQGWPELGYGTWTSHVREWHKIAAAPGNCFLTYHELLADTPGSLLRIAGCLGVASDLASAEGAAEKISVEWMRGVYGKDFVPAARTHYYGEVLPQPLIDQGLATFDAEISEFQL